MLNIKILEDLYINNKVDLNFLNMYQSIDLDILFASIAHIFEPHQTLSEVIHTFDEKDIYVRYDQLESFVIEAFYPHLVDINAIRNREDNILTVSKDSTNWKDGFTAHLAEFISNSGRPVLLNSGFYGWTDYQFNTKNHGEVIFASMPKSNGWDEFEGTFHEGDTRHYGYDMDVVYADGQSRVLRIEGTLDEFMKNLF